MTGHKDAAQRMRQDELAGTVIWFTGLSGAGKSTLARGLLEHLRLTLPELRVELLDADQVRTHLSRDLGFSRADREENVRRLGYVAGLLSRHGVVVLVAAMSPYREGRNAVRHSVGHFVEVFVDAPLPTCEARDPTGIYGRFRRGEIQDVSGLDTPYEPPAAPEVHCRTAGSSPAVCIEQILRALGLR